MGMCNYDFNPHKRPTIAESWEGINSPPYSRKRNRRRILGKFGHLKGEAVNCNIKNARPRAPKEWDRLPDREKHIIIQYLKDKVMEELEIGRASCRERV